MTARVEFTHDTASPALKRLMASLQGAGREQMLGEMGEYLMRSTRDRAARQEAPDGSKWKALSPAYAKWKQKQRPGVPMLKFDFHMLGDMLAYQVDAAGLQLGSSAPYAARQHFGGSHTRAASSTLLSFRVDKDTGQSRFAKRKRANLEQWAEVPEHTVATEGRPFLGITPEDETELLNIAAAHFVHAAFERRFGG